MKYSGSTHLYSLHAIQDAKQQITIEPYEFIVNIFTQSIVSVVNHLCKLGLIIRPKNIDSPTIFLKLTNRNSFIIYARREYKIDMLKKEKELNNAYDSIKEDSDDDSEDEFSNNTTTIIYTTNNCSINDLNKIFTNDDSVEIIDSSYSIDSDDEYSN